MYGRLFADKLKPLVDQAFKAVYEQYESDLAAGKKRDKKPGRISSWVTVVKEEYGNESDDVKRIVERAVKEDAKNTRITQGGPEE